MLTRDQNWCHKVMLFTSLRWSVCSCLLPLQHYEKTSTILKIDGQGQYYWDRAIKFTRWQHSAMRRRARFDTSGTSCLILVYEWSSWESWRRSIIECLQWVICVRGNVYVIRRLRTTTWTHVTDVRCTGRRTTTRTAANATTQLTLRSVLSTSAHYAAVTRLLTS